MKDFRRLLRYVRPYLGRLVSAAVCSGFISLVFLGLLILIQPISELLFPGAEALAGAGAGVGAGAARPRPGSSGVAGLAGRAPAARAFAPSGRRGGWGPPAPSSRLFSGVCAPRGPSPRLPPLSGPPPAGGGGGGFWGSF